MKSRTLTLIIAAVMLIAVGVLVWPEPEEASGNVVYTIQVWDNTPADDGPVQGVLCRFIFNGNVESQSTTDANGKASFLRPQAFPGNWTAWCGATFIDPGEQDEVLAPQTTFHQFTVEDLNQ